MNSLFQKMTAPELPPQSPSPAEKQCQHRLKKNLFASTTVKRALTKEKKRKNATLACEVCQREQKKADDARESEEETPRNVFICTAEGCGKLYCGCMTAGHFDCHMHRHAGNTEHPIFYDVKERKLWCDPCGVELLPDPEASNDHVKRFLNEMPKKIEEKQEKAILEKTVGVEVRNGRTRNTGASKDVMINGSAKTEASEEENRVNGVTNDGTGLPHIKGLRNLGLTCYYNSTMQCLMHTHLMQDYVEKMTELDGWTCPRVNGFKIEGKEPFVLPKKRFEISKSVFRGFVFTALQTFFTEFRVASSINPGALLDAVRNSYKRSVLPLWTQCDASEAFMLLSECLEQDERRLRKMAIKQSDYTFFKKLPKDEAIAVYSKMADQDNMPTRIDAVFGMVNIQLIRCQDLNCSHVSTRLVASKNLILHLNFTTPGNSSNSGGRFTKNENSNGKQMSKYKQKKLKEKKKKEIRRVRKNTGPSLSTSEVEEQHNEAEKFEAEEDPEKIIEEEANDLESFLGVPVTVNSAPIPLRGLESENEAQALDFGSPIGPSLRMSDLEDDVIAEDSGSGSEGEVEASDVENGVEEAAEVNGTEEEGALANGDAKNFEATLAPYKREPHSGLTLTDCLANWTAPNEITSYQCDECCPEKSKKRVEAVQRTFLFAPPPVLVLCLQRATLRYTKVSTPVKFDLVLDLAPFCVNYGLRINHEQKELKYGLYGIVIHEGYSSNSGHYTACVRRRKPPANIRKRFDEAFGSNNIKPEEIKNLIEQTREGTNEGDVAEPSEKDQWYYVSDNHYHQISWQEVSRKQAFMLFYERLG
ncbi:hypothetical protein L596_020074 [Steinernema carpocapsae]|uniref:ubiquitinyl hydrolase 1 n=1 Tax=Steinernema carpocapsae TaxID=34508 RepID=A0A4U5MSH4_STECR|nr:hypothetical protein L596_020074 [Steinernema carpocapsae]